MTRIHRITHPTFGPISWAELRQRRTPKRCTWCGGALEGRCRTICRAEECHTAIDRITSWESCASAAKRRDKHACTLCGTKDAPCCETTLASGYHVDHVVPVSLGGTGDLSNLRTLCRACHRQETTRLRREGRSFVARTVANCATVGDQP